MKRALLLVVALVAASLGMTGTAGAGGIFVEVQLVSAVEPLTLQVELHTATCDTPLAINSVKTVQPPSDEFDVTPLAVVPGTSNNVTNLVLPSDTRPGLLQVEAQCTSGGIPVGGFGEMAFASIAVTKVVSGTAPSGTTFLVRLDCEGGSEGGDEVDLRSLPDDFVAEVTFGASGGLKYVYTDHPAVCTVTEPGSGGATSVQISPAVVDTTPAPASYATTVTNTFAAAIQPTFTG